MKWTNELSLTLIDQYKRLPILWNPKHPWYFSRKKKLYAWNVIATNMNTTIANAKQKMNSLLGSLRRERMKGKKLVGADRKAVYSSEWFAFKRMQFLLHREQPTDDTDERIGAPEGETDDSEALNIKVDMDDLSEMEETEVVENNQMLVYAEPLAPIDDTTSACVPSVAKKSNANEAIRSDSSRILNQPVISSGPPDACNVYGQHVANKLSTYSKQTRAEVEYRINQILYDADMERFEKKVQTATEEMY